MYEFDSVSVVQFEADTLAATLTERSAEGWEVTAIVTAGSNVVAYLQRRTDDGEVDAADSTAAPTDADETLARVEPDSSTDAASDNDVAASTDSVASSVAAQSAPGTAANDLLSSSDSTATAAAGGDGWAASTDSSTTAASPAATTPGTATSATATPASAPAAQAASTPSVPAGWYADPAKRFELRYWDGSAWTEHVSRAGQQYTDPPVA